MDVVIDTDVLSAFAKINKLELLQRLFPKSAIILAPNVYKEIKKGGKARDSKIFPTSKVLQNKARPV